MSAREFNQMLFNISNKTSNYTYSSLAIAYSNKLDIYEYMNALRHVHDNYSATVLSICECLLRGNEIKALELIKYYNKEWELLNG